MDANETSAAVIGAVRSDTTASASRVYADVDGTTVWFESEDIELCASPEAFGSTFVIAAALAGRQLRIEDNVNPVWYDNIRRAIDIAAEWWKCSRDIPQASSAHLPAREPNTEVALPFSGGADSFHTLFQNKDRLRYLVFVHGFDMPLSDKTRAAHCERSIRRIADKFDLNAVVIRTNLREHPLFVCSNWEITHGGALGALGHLMSNQIGRLLIAPSYPASYGPWGSHVDLDPCWSSDRVTIEPDPTHGWRHERIREIAGEEAVWHELRVCYENRTPTGNCSQCSKCVFTMLVLAECRMLDRFTVFDLNVPLAERLDNLPFLPAGHIYFKFFEALIARNNLEPDVIAAINSLSRRSAVIATIREECNLLQQSNRDWQQRCAYLEEQLNFLRHKHTPIRRRLFNWLSAKVR
jgi:hypothetical protein